MTMMILDKNSIDMLELKKQMWFSSSDENAKFTEQEFVELLAMGVNKLIGANYVTISVTPELKEIEVDSVYDENGYAKDRTISTFSLSFDGLQDFLESIGLINLYDFLIDKYTFLTVDMTLGAHGLEFEQGD